VAHGSQFTLSIMENQTCFNLNEAITRWREELAAQPGVSAEQIRELESHLLDSLADLQRRGLTEEESFVVASRRLGGAKDIAAEIVKADPSIIWKERMFWLVAGLIVVQVWFRIAMLPMNAVLNLLSLNRVDFDGIAALYMVPMYGVVGWAMLAIARGRFLKLLADITRFARSPRRVAFALGLFLVMSTFSTCFDMWILAKSYALGMHPRPHFPILWNTIGNITWPTILGVVLLRLTKDLSRNETADSLRAAK
jgi:hypothetical protein